MANRCTLHKSRLDDFKSFLDNHGIAYRPGKASFQVLQVMTPYNDWQCIHRNIDTAEHYTVQDKLMPIIREFLTISSASKREPHPKPGKTNVLPLVIKDLQERDKIGRQKYGTTLQTHNGRNCLMDAYQEALDLAMYLKQALLEQE